MSTPQSVTNDSPDSIFTAAGFWFEDFLDCWMKAVDGKQITISNGMSQNGEMFEVQVMTEDGEGVAYSDGNQTPESAVAFAASVVESTCP